MKALDLRSEAGFALKQFILIVAIIVLIVALAVPMYQNLKIKSLEAEAQVMLSYLSTLQSAHFADSGTHVFFDKFYGAPMEGKDNCDRPQGAADLGFILRNCHKDPRNGGLRYAYKIETTTDNKLAFRAVAKSGTDLSGESYVCLGANSTDLWTIGATKNHVHEENCK